MPRKKSKPVGNADAPAAAPKPKARKRKAESETPQVVDTAAVEPKVMIN